MNQCALIEKTIKPKERFGVSISAAVAIIMVLYGLLAINAFTTYLGWRGIYTLVILGACTLLATTASKKITIRPWFFLAIILMLLTSTITALYWNDPRYTLALIFLIFSLLLLQLADMRAIDFFISISSMLLVLILAGACIGFLIALAGVPPLFDFPNLDSRPNYFYYTTFSNAVLGNVIRPAGIYDEPGALSFMVCAVAAMRHLRDRDRRLTWLLLSLGFVTLSLAHLIYVVTHLLSERVRKRHVWQILTVIVPVFLVLASLGGFEILDEYLLQRLTVTETDQLAGDNRSQQMFNALDHLRSNPKSILFGADPACRFDYDVCNQLFFQMGENPLTPLAYTGLLVAWPFYIVLLLLFIAPLRNRRYFVAFGFGLLLMQRPYFDAIGYSLFGVLLVWFSYASSPFHTDGISTAVVQKVRNRF